MTVLIRSGWFVRRVESGFTLLEVMIALAVFGITAAAVVLANTQTIRSAQQIEEQTQARWVSQNMLTQMRLEENLPDPGQNTQRISYGGTEWVVQVDIDSVEMELLGTYLRYVTIQSRRAEEEQFADSLIAVLGKTSGITGIPQ